MGDFPGWMCCFCGEHIKEAGDETVVLNVRAAQDLRDDQQTLFSHIECFKRALHPSVRSGLHCMMMTTTKQGL